MGTTTSEHLSASFVLFKPHHRVPDQPCAIPTYSLHGFLLLASHLCREGLPRVALCCRDHQLVLRASQHDDQVRSSSRQVHGLLCDVPRRCCAKGCERCHCHHQDQAYHSVRRLVPNRLQVRYQLPATNRSSQVVTLPR